jgi:regulator of replication initiation timing
MRKQRDSAVNEKDLLESRADALESLCISFSQYRIDDIDADEQVTLYVPLTTSDNDIIHTHLTDVHREVQELRQRCHELRQSCHQLRSENETKNSESDHLKTKLQELRESDAKWEERLKQANNARDEVLQKAGSAAAISLKEVLESEKVRELKAVITRLKYGKKTAEETVEDERMRAENERQKAEDERERAETALRFAYKQCTKLHLQTNQLTAVKVMAAKTIRQHKDRIIISANNQIAIRDAEVKLANNKIDIAEKDKAYE